MIEANDNEVVDLDKTTVETIKEQIRENRTKIKEFNEESNNSFKNKLFIFSVKGFLVSIVAVIVILILVSILNNNLPSPVSTYIPNYIDKAFICVMFVPFVFLALISVFGILDLFRDPLKSEDFSLRRLNGSLYAQMIEIVLGGKVVSGEVSEKWSEITIDKTTHMSKIMARFVGEDKLDIETRSIILE